MAINGLKPTRRQSTAEHIAEELRSAILSGRLEPGTQLGEVDLAETFEVSRGPVREALQRLVSEGLAEALLNRGVFVIELTVDDIIDVYQTRGVIELGALDLIMTNNLRDAAHAALEPSLNRMREAAREGDASGVSNADQQFHEDLVACANSPRLTRAMRTLLAETRIALGELEETYADLSTQVREHEQLREAIAKASAFEITTLLREHLNDAVERLEQKRSTAAE